MKVYTPTQARANKKTTKSLAGTKNANVLDFRMKESIRRGLKTPLKNCAKALDW